MPWRRVAPGRPLNTARPPTYQHFDHLLHSQAARHRLRLVGRQRRPEPLHQGQRAAPSAVGLLRVGPRGQQRANRGRVQVAGGHVQGGVACTRRVCVVAWGGMGWGRR